MGSERSLNRLSALFVKRNNTPGNYSDGGGLWMQVHGPTSKSWIYRYRLAGRERELGLGPVSDVSLAEAREAAAEARKMKLNGIDPIDAKREARARADRSRNSPVGVTFDEAAAAYVRTNRAGWKNSKHAGQWTSTLNAYASPVFGKRAVSEIDRPAVLAVVEPIWATKSETASRLRGRIEAILDWATVMGYRYGDNPARWKGNLDKVLPARSKVSTVEHHRTLPYDLMPDFFSRLLEQKGIASQALQFTILTAGRTSEVLGARWSEINMTTMLWTVPASRMKAGKEHRVPLCEQTIKALPDPGSGGDLIFPHPLTGRSLSVNAMTAVLKRMNADATVHGFRSAFRDWAAEETDFAGEVVEVALAHTILNKVEAAYRRGDLLEKRRGLMASWGAYCLNSPDRSAETERPRVRTHRSRE